MSTRSSDIGVVGLAVMGRNLVLNIADHGFRVAAFNRTASVTREFASALEPGQHVQPCYSPEEFVGALARPRRILMMVKAGPPVDSVIDSLQGSLEPGDILMDGGNSHYADTERRAGALAAAGIHYLGVGISGGERGARNGPSLMPGGPAEAYESVRGVLEAIAARADGEPCVKYLGKGAAGHYTKMVHNGIEYGFMQLIAESYALMRQALGLHGEEMAAVYESWNEAELESYLVEITAEILRRRDAKTGGYVVDMIRGEAGQLGTGVWTSQSAMALQVPAPGIDAAVAMRSLSALAGQRRAVQAVLGPDPSGTSAGQLTVEHVRGALYAGMVLTYAQGFSVLQTASVKLGYDLTLEDVASIWRGGCIIRAGLLRDIKAAFQRRPDLPNLLLDRELAAMVSGRRPDLARTVETGVAARIPVPGFMAALGYLDGYRSEWLPLNLIQAQRDHFGAHEYQRIDVEGWFHTDWLANETGL
ncbi:MAG: NADP-dependent phosphogluconate dehydrogenase [Thermoleophilia bacterium]|nr:NADP-dependent phosphogluconate dehydrogenase [Thermoleophilia bacterium]